MACSLYDQYSNLTAESANNRLYFEYALSKLEDSKGSYTLDNFRDELNPDNNPLLFSKTDTIYEKAIKVYGGGYDELELPTKHDQAAVVNFLSGQLIEKRLEVNEARLENPEITSPTLPVLLFNSDKNDSYLERLIDSKIALNNEYSNRWKLIKKYYSNHENVTGFVDKIISNLKGTYNISENLDWANENLFDKAFDKSILETNRKDNVNSELKEILSLIVEGKRDRYIGEPKYIQFDPIYNKLYVEMSDLISIDEMDKKLSKLAFISPIYKQIYDKIKLPLQDSKDFDKAQRLRNAFFTSFRNSYFNSVVNNYRVVESTDRYNNTTKKIVAGSFYTNQNSPENVLISTWKEKYDKGISDEEKKTFPKQYEAILNAITKGSDIDTVVDKLASLMQKVGIDVIVDGKSILREAMKQEAKYEQPGNEIGFINDKFFDPFKNIIVSIIKNKPIYSNRDKDSFGQAEGTSLRAIASILKLYDHYIYESTTSNVKGDNVWAINQPSYFSEILNKFKADSPEKINSLQQLLNNYKKTSSFAFSNWLPKFLKEDGTINIEEVQKVKFYLIGGQKLDDINEGLRYKDSSVKDHLILGLVNYAFNDDHKIGRYILPTQSDSSQNYLIEYLRIPLQIRSLEALKKESKDYIAINFKYKTKSGKLRTIALGGIDKEGNIYKAFENNLKSELTKMREARELLFEGNGELKHIYSSKLTDEEKANKEFMSERRDELSKLIQYYHFQKTNTEGEPILLDKEGKATGNVFKFQYFSHLNNDSTLFNNNGTITSDFKRIDDEVPFAIMYKINGEILPGEFERYNKYDINEFLNDQTLPSQFKHTVASNKEEGKSIDVSKEFLLADFALNYALFIPEYDNLFSGGTAFNKSKDDAIKREKQVTAHSQHLPLPGSFYGAYVKDIKIKASSFDIISNNITEDLKKRKPFLSEEEITKEVSELLKPYENINSTDSMTFITPERWFDIINSMGRWGKTKEQRDAAKSIIDGSYSSKDINLILQTLKPFYYGLHFDTNLNIMVPVQVKNAEMPLLPNIIAGTDMERILNALYKQKVQSLIFESAGKVGASGITSIADEEGNLNEEGINNLIKKPFYNANYGIQLDNPNSHLDHPTVMGLQPKKLVLTDLTGTYTDLMGESKSLSGDQLLDRHNRIESSLITSSSRQLFNRIGLKRNGNGELVIRDLRKLQSILRDQILTSKLNDNYNDATELREVTPGHFEFEVPLWQSISGKNMEKVILSLFSKAVTNQKITGFSAIQGTSTFFKNSLGAKGYSTNLSSINHKLRDKIELIDRKRKDYENGNFSLGVNNGKFEVLLPATAKAYFEKEGIVDINNLPEDLRTFFAYRIPFQGKYSAAAIEVVGFLPPEVGSTVIIPNEILVRMGSDFDIDKLYGMGYAFNKVKGEYVIDEYSTSEESAEDRYNKYADEVEQSLKKVDQITKSNIDYFNEQVNSGASEEDIQDAEDNITETLIENKDLPSFDEFIKLPVEDQNTQNAKKNAMLSDFLSVMSNAEHQGEQSSPTNFDKIKKLANKYGKGEDKGISKQSYTQQIERAFSARQDKVQIGRLASNNAYTLSIMKALKATLADELSIPKRYTKSEVEKYNLKERYKDEIIEESPDGSIVISLKKIGWSTDPKNTNVHGDSISENYSQVIGAATDGIKDPSLHYINFNTFTSNALGAAILVGHDWDFAAALGNQPIIKHLTDIYFSEGSGYNAIKKSFSREKKGDVQLALDQITSELREILGTKLPVIEDIELAFSVHQLDGFINDNARDKNYYLNQYKVLLLFNKLTEAGNALTKNLLALRSDSIGAGPTTSTTNDMIRAIQGATGVYSDGENLMEQVYPSVFNINRPSKYTALEAYFNESNLNSLELIKKLFVKESIAFKSLQSSLFSVLRQTPGTDYTKYENRLNDYAVAHMSSNFELFSTPYENLYKGENSLMNRGLKLREDHPELLGDGKLFSYITFENSPEEIFNNQRLHMMSLKNTQNGMTRDMENLVIEDFYNLLTEENQELRDFAIDLVKFNYHTYGMLPNIRSFTSLIPIKWLKEIGYYDHLQGESSTLDNSGALSDVLENYIQHNYKDVDLIPTTDTVQYGENDYTGEYGPIYGRIKADKETGILRIPVERERDGTDKRIHSAIYVVAKKEYTHKQVEEFREKGFKVDRFIPILYRYLGVDVDGNRYFRPIDKKGLGNRMYEFNAKTIIYSDYPKTDEEYINILKNQKNSISLSLYDNNENMDINLTEENPIDVESNKNNFKDTTEFKEWFEAQRAIDNIVTDKELEDYYKNCVLMFS